MNPGEDVRSTRGLIETLGANVSEAAGAIRIDGTGGHFTAPGTALDCGNSGTTMRLMAGLLAGQPFRSWLVGDRSLSSRPMERIARPLREMGAEVRTTGGAAPLEIRGGGLSGISYTTPVASAQIKSAVLLAGLFAEGATRVEEPAASRDHTERMLARSGAKLTRNGLTVSLEPGPLEPLEMEVPGDPSAAAFYVGAAVLRPGSKLTVRNVGVNPTRTGFLKVLERMGARVTERDAREAGGEPVADLVVEASALHGTAIAGDEIPSLIDEVPILSVAAACAEGPTEISGASELRVKESDRLAAIAEGLQALGVPVRETDDGLWIGGGGFRRGGSIDAKGDHRIAMSFMIAALCGDEAITVLGSEVAAISDPEFARRLGRLASG